MKARILIVDDEPAIRAMLSDFLESEYDVENASNADEALQKVDEHSFDLVISDINMPGMKGYELLSRIKHKFPNIKTVLITAYNVDEYIRLARSHGICNIVSKTSPFNFVELQNLVRALTSEDIFGLHHYLDAGFQTLGKWTIQSSDEARAVRQTVLDTLPPLPRDANEIKLVVDEIITNAIYHAPHGNDGTRKYKDYQPIQLGQGEQVLAQVGQDQHKIAISILDQQGHLDKDRVLYLIDRHVNAEGIFDESGRGIYMSRIFSDRLILNIDPGKRTEVIIMYYLQADKFKGFKPLYIHQL